MLPDAIGKLVGEFFDIIDPGLKSATLRQTAVTAIFLQRRSSRPADESRMRDDQKISLPVLLRVVDEIPDQQPIYGPQGSRGPAQQHQVPRRTRRQSEPDLSGHLDIPDIDPAFCPVKEDGGKVCRLKCFDLEVMADGRCRQRKGETVLPAKMKATGIGDAEGMQHHVIGCDRAYIGDRQYIRWPPQ